MNYFNLFNVARTGLSNLDRKFRAQFEIGFNKNILFVLICFILTIKMPGKI